MNDEQFDLWKQIRIPIKWPKTNSKHERNEELRCVITRLKATLLFFSTSLFGVLWAYKESDAYFNNL